MSGGFYKRRRGILEHLEAGRISLLDLAVHDYLNLKANLAMAFPSLRVFASLPPRQSTRPAQAKSLNEQFSGRSSISRKLAGLKHGEFAENAEITRS
jgi:hypothetical protein